MNTFHDRCKQVGTGLVTRSRLLSALTAAVFLGCLWTPGMARAQVLPSAEAGGFRLSAGGAASGSYIQYGERKLGGVSAFVDAETHHRLGIEGEGRWLEYHENEQVHVETYSAGLRYHVNFSRFQPYVKGLIGFGDINFPFGFAHGRYLVVSGGGGLDYRWSGRIRFRLPDVEYQDWPQFTAPGGMTYSMNSVAISAGVKVGIF